MPQFARTIRTVGAAALALSAFGCASRHVPSVGDHRYEGPPLTLESTGPAHVLVLAAPSGGYALTIDRVLERSKSYDLFATVRTPDPRFVHTQAAVTLRALSPLASTERIRVCARVLPAGSEEDPAYPVALPLPPAK